MNRAGMNFATSALTAALLLAISTAANAGVMIRMLDGPNGVFTGEQVKEAIRDPNSRNAPRSRLVSIENTSNGGCGTV